MQHHQERLSVRNNRRNHIASVAYDTLVSVIHYQERRFFKWIFQVLFLLLTGVTLSCSGNYKQITYDTLSAPTATSTVNIAAQKDAEILKNAGNELAQAGDFTSALEKYEDALELYRRANDEAGEAQVLFNIGLVYAYTPEHQRALDYYDQSITLWRVVKNPIKEADTLVNVALVYTELGDYTSAIQSYEQALTIFQANDETHKAALVLNGLGDAHYTLGDYKQALAYLKQAQTLWQTLQDRENEALSNRLISLIEQLVKLEDDRALYTELQAGAEIPITQPEETPAASSGGAIDRSATATTVPTDDPKGQAEQLFEEGWQLFENGQLQAALPKFEAALPFYRQALNRPGEAFCLLAIGFVKAGLSDYVGALAAYQASLPIFRAINDQSGEVTALNNIGHAYDNLGQYQQALDHYEPALTLYRALNNRVGEGIVLNNIGSIYRILGGSVYRASGGSVYRTLGQYQQALEAFDDALVIAKETMDQEGEGITLNNIGGVYQYQGKYQEALQQYQQALTIFQTINDQAQQATTLNNIGAVYDNLARYRDALDTYAQALALFQGMDHRLGEGTTLNNIGSIHQNLGEYEQALTQYQLALTIFQSIRSRAGKVTTLNNQGSLYRQRGQYQQALEVFEQAFAIAQELQHQASLILIRNNIGAVYEDQSRYEAALIHYQEVLTTAQAIGDQASAGGALNNLGSVNAKLGQYETAKKNLDQALEIRQQIGDQKGQVSTLINLGALYTDLERHELALEQYQQAFDLAQMIGDLPDAAIALNNIGIYYGITGQPQLALDAFQVLRKLWIELGNRASEGAALNNLGAAHTMLRQNRDALASFEQALAIFQELNDTAGQGATLGYLGYFYEIQEDLPQALDYYKQAIAQVELVQGDLRAEELKITFAGEQFNLYERLVNLLWVENRTDEAFVYSERARARAFLDQIGNQQVDFRRGAEPELIEQEQALRQQMVGLQHTLNANRTGRAEQSNEAVRTKLEQARKDYANLLVQLKLHSPQYADLISVDTLNLREVQNQVIPAQTTLIAYFVMEKQTLAWVIDQQNVVTVSLNITRTALANDISFMYQIINQKDVDAQAAARLYDTLFAPLTPYIRYPTLLITPHDVLHYLPFAALWNPEREGYLVEEYAIAYVPSASALRFIQDKHNHTDGNLLFMANDGGNLDHVVDEVTAIAELYKAKPFINRQATESQIYKQDDQIGLLHVAAHGRYEPLTPFFSRIELAADNANDGNLEVHEIFGLNLQNTNLVVLSACDTALGQQSRGDDIVGLTRAFLYAGTPSIMTSLWNIDDVAASELMVSFYQHLHHGQTTTAALQAAQREILANAAWHSPYYWGAFSLHGDGQQILQPQGER